MSTETVILVVLITAQGIIALITYYYRNDPVQLARIEELEKTVSEIMTSIEHTKLS
jgi:hypothetical protein